MATAVETEQVKVLSTWMSPFGMHILIALEEKGVQYECLEEDFSKGKSQLLIQMNPVYKKIPILIHNGKPVWARIMRTKGEAHEEAKRDMLEFLEMLEGAIRDLAGGEGPYFGGWEFGIIDIALIPCTSCFDATERIGMFKIPWDTQFPLLKEWKQNSYVRVMDLLALFSYPYERNSYVHFGTVQLSI